MGPETFNRLFTMHGTTMVFLVGNAVCGGISNYLVPLMIGARDMAFPRLNAFGYWFFFSAGCCSTSATSAAADCRGMDRPPTWGGLRTRR